MILFHYAVSTSVYSSSNYFEPQDGQCSGRYIWRHKNSETAS